MDEITPSKMERFCQCLKDNGIDQDECGTLAEALCAILLDEDVSEYIGDTWY